MQLIAVTVSAVLGWASHPGEAVPSVVPLVKLEGHPLAQLALGSNCHVGLACCSGPEQQAGALTLTIIHAGCVGRLYIGDRTVPNVLCKQSHHFTIGPIRGISGHTEAANGMGSIRPVAAPHGPRADGPRLRVGNGSANVVLRLMPD
jgi:hypothetical protein